MSDAQKKTVKLLDSKLDNKTIKTLTTCAIVMIIAVLIHDGDHIRQAYNWGYSIPISLWVLNSSGELVVEYKYDPYGKQT